MSPVERATSRRTVAWRIVASRGDTRVAGTVRDVSQAGAFVEVDDHEDVFQFRRGSTVTLEFVDDRVDNGARLVAASVRWQGYSACHSTSGLGVEFEQTQPVLERSAAPCWDDRPPSSRPRRAATSRAAIVRAIAVLYALPSKVAVELIGRLLFAPLSPLAAIAARYGSISKAPVASSLGTAAGLLAIGVGLRLFVTTLEVRAALGVLGYVVLFANLQARRTVLHRGIADHATFAELRESLARGSWFVRWFGRQTRHPEDAIWLRTMFAGSVVLIPPTLALVMATAGWVSVWVAIPWYAVTAAQYTSLGASTHLAQHCTPFRPRRGATVVTRVVMRALATYFEFVLVVLDGKIPFAEKVTHNVDHHVTNNGDDDFESTYPYDRSSFCSYSPMWLRLMLSYSFPARLALSLWRRGKVKYSRQLVVGMVYGHGLIAIWLWIDLPIALTVLGIRSAMLGLLVGDLAYFTHPLVEVNARDNAFANSADSVAPDVALLGNDVHAAHHAYPGRHWTQALKLRDSLSACYDQHRTAVFPDLVLGNIQYLLFAGEFRIVGAHRLSSAEMRRVAAERMDDEEALSFGKQRSAAVLDWRAQWVRCRVAPLHLEDLGGVYRLIDRIVAKLARVLVPDIIFAGTTRSQSTDVISPRESRGAQR